MKTMEAFYKILVYAFLVMGIVSLVSVLFGAVHQLIIAFICFLIHAMLKGELREKKEEQ